MRLAALFGVGQRVTFIQGTFGETSVPSTDAYYLYNPFGQNLFGTEDQLDEAVELGDARFLRDIHHVEQLLDSAAAGTFLLTYNGFD